jgi:hypothetical protein
VFYKTTDVFDVSKFVIDWNTRGPRGPSFCESHSLLNPSSTPTITHTEETHKSKVSKYLLFGVLWAFLSSDRQMP